MAPHGIEFIPEEGMKGQPQYQQRAKIAVEKVAMNGTVVTYLATIGWFRVRVSMLNLNWRAKTGTDKCIEGPYRQIIGVQNKSNGYAIRRIYS